MSINRSCSQQLFESIFTVGPNKPFKNFKKSDYEKTTLSQRQAQSLHNYLSQEVLELYNKALLSFAEAIIRIEYKSFSWPTIELYYSVFYATKAFINAYDYAVLRAERRLFYVLASANERFKRCENTTDHKAVFEIIKKQFPNDYFLSNTIDGEFAYDWLMAKREDINYRDRLFSDPIPPDFWGKINEELKHNSVKDIVEKLSLDSRGLLCFQPDYAILALPIKRLKLTADIIRMRGLRSIMTADQREFITSMLIEMPDAFKTDIIV